MLHSDTLELLCECDSGVKMAVDSLNEIMDSVSDSKLYDILRHGRDEHMKYGSDITSLLQTYDSVGKKPSAAAKGAAHIKTNLMLDLSPGDKTVSSIVTDGCNMGIKSLEKRLNEFPNADESTQKIAYGLIDIEKNMNEQISAYL